MYGRYIGNGLFANAIARIYVQKMNTQLYTYLLPRQELIP